MSRNNEGDQPEQPAKRARLKDVAQLAGVDISVVSRALRDDPNLAVAPETRSRILLAAEKLQYRPNAMARALRQAQTMSLGLLVPDVANIVYFDLIQGIEQRAFEAGYVLLLANAHENKKAEEVYKRLVLERRIDGLLIASAADDERLPFTPRGDSPPVLWVNRRGKGPSVLEDDERGMGLAVERLIALGHTDIAHIAGPQVFDTGRRRLHGFMQAMERAGLTPSPAHVVEGPFTEQGGMDCMLTLLRTNPRPTAVTASSLVATIGALAAARQVGLGIPEELSIIAFHDAVIASYLDPAVTTVQMPLRELGRVAVESLLHMMGGGELPPETILPVSPRLIERASTAPPRQQRTEKGRPSRKTKE